MEKKRLLFVSGHLNIGGAEKSLVDILRHIDYEQYDVDLLLVEDLGDYASLLPAQVHIILKPLQSTYGSLIKCLLGSFCRRDWFTFRMRFLMLKARYLGNKFFAPAGKLLLGKQHYDCAIGFRPDVCTQIAAFAAKADKSISWWHHGEFFLEGKSYLKLTESCAAIVAVSDACKQMLATEFPQLTDRLTVIPNILDASAIRQRAVDFNPYPNKIVPHIVSVGRLSPEKHFENVLYAAKKMKDCGGRFCWHIVGDGPLRSELENLAQTLAVKDVVFFHGNQSNPYPYIKNADLFVHPSYVESFGIVVAEALALGVACVVTKSMGIMEFLRDGENAVLTEQNAEDLSEKIIKVLNDSDLRKKLRDNSVCPEQYSPDNVVKQIYDIL